MNKSEQVYQYLRKKIISGEINPGDPVRFSDIEDELDVSKIPFREALKKLEANGLVEIIHNTGARVKRTDLNEMEQIALVRLELEALATSMAAEKIDEDTIERLWRYIDKMDELVAAGDKESYSEVNREFHMEVYRASQANFISQLIEDLWERSEKTMLVFNFIPERFTESNKEHKELVKYLEAHDKIGAAETLRKQKSGAFLAVIRMLKQYEMMKI